MESKSEIEVKIRKVDDGNSEENRGKFEETLEGFPRLFSNYANTFYFVRPMFKVPLPLPQIRSR